MEKCWEEDGGIERGLWKSLSFEGNERERFVEGDMGLGRKRMKEMWARDSDFKAIDDWGFKVSMVLSLSMFLLYSYSTS